MSYDSDPTLTIRTSEQRSRLSELAGLDELTDEQRAELGTLGTEHQDTEAQLRAAIASAPDEANAAIDPAVDPEVRERLELRGSASLGRYLAAMLTGQPVTGPEAEYQAACKVPGIPIDLFEQDRPERFERTRRAAYRQPGPGRRSHRFSRSCSRKVSRRCSGSKCRLSAAAPTAR